MFHSPLIRANRFSSRNADGFFSRVQPTPVDNPRLVHLNHALSAEFGLQPEDFSAERFLDYLGGKPLPAHLDPIAMAYSGHQFGVFNPGLGDGRAILLNEFKDRSGECWEFQLKGSGPTPYSRGFDGRAVLRSVIREYLGSEAVWGLGIPSTRALCLVDSESPVIREQIETGSMMIRVSPSHIRFGSFELFYGQGQHQHLKQLADYCIVQHFNEIKDGDDRYGLWFDEIVRRTAQMVAHWQAVGFCHGVMNTDNFSILGLTFDYGPFGFMEHYDPGHVCNHSDHQGRYAYDQQPRMAFWNCMCLAQALTPIVQHDRLQQALELFEPALQQQYLQLLRAKLGLQRPDPQDSPLVTRLLELLAREKLDYSRFFRGLCHLDTDRPGAEWIYQQGDREAIDAWLNDYRRRLEAEATGPVPRQQAMLRRNPKYILRNYLAQEAIEQAQQGDYGEVERLLQLVHHPYDEHPEFERYAESAPPGAAGLSVSCSS